MASYPATELLLSRARFCVSAAHSVEDIDQALKTMEELGDLLMLRYHRKHDS
jgi:serine palmitoyltransferase